MSIDFDASELVTLKLDLGDLAVAALPAVRGVLQESAADIKAKWRENAVVTSGQHGRHYPNSITYKTHLLPSGIVAEIGPDPTKPQGGMSFENGSVNQPPHHDGKKAADVVVPQIAKRIDSALGFLGL